MEVFRVPTPTYSGNYKANLESFPVEYVLAPFRACRVGLRRSGERPGELWPAPYRRSRARPLPIAPLR